MTVLKLCTMLTGSGGRRAGWERKTGQAVGGLYMPIDGNKIKGLGRVHIGFGSLLGRLG
jgi:hypothetical protein